MRKWTVKNSSVVIIQIGVLYIINLIGVGLSSLLNLPIPGSIIGLLLLLASLHFKIIPEKWIQKGSGVLLIFLPLFLIPATVGVIQFPTLLSMKGILMIGIIIVSTLITIVVVGWIGEKYGKQIKDEAGEKQ